MLKKVKLWCGGLTDKGWEVRVLYWQNTVVSVNSASHACVIARLRAKCWQRCVWAGLLSAETTMIRTAETVMMVEGNTG